MACGVSTSASTNGASGQYISGKTNKTRKGVLNNNQHISMKRKGSITTANGNLGLALFQ